MKEFLKEFLIEPFRDMGIMGWIMGVFAWAVLITVVGLLLWLGLWLVDSQGLSTKKDEGIITEKCFNPAHYSTTYMLSGKIMIPITTYIPDNYSVNIKVKELQDNVSLSHEDWESVDIQEKVVCTYVKGRLFNTIYIKSFYPVKQ